MQNRAASPARESYESTTQADRAYRGTMGIQAPPWRRGHAWLCITLLGGAAAVWPVAAWAQQPAMPPFVGAFRQGLNEAGPRRSPGTRFRAHRTISRAECRNYFRYAGYAPIRPESASENRSVMPEQAFGGLDRESLTLLEGLARHGSSPLPSM
jgi:hypothetical protein